MCSVLPFFDAGEVSNKFYPRKCWKRLTIAWRSYLAWKATNQIELNTHFFRFLVFWYLCIQIVSDASNFELWRLPELLGHWGNQLWWVYGDQGDTTITQKQTVWLSITSASDVSHHCHHQRSCIFFQAGVNFCKFCRKFTHFWRTFYRPNQNWQIWGMYICKPENLASVSQLPLR